jgi:hypothetical protein
MELRAAFPRFETPRRNVLRTARRGALTEKRADWGVNIVIATGNRMAQERDTGRQRRCEVEAAVFGP